MDPWISPSIPYPITPLPVEPRMVTYPPPQPEIARVEPQMVEFEETRQWYDIVQAKAQRIEHFIYGAFR